MSRGALLLLPLGGCAQFVIGVTKNAADRELRVELSAPAEGEQIVGSVVTFVPEVRGSRKDLEIDIELDGEDLLFFRWPEVQSITIDTRFPPGVFDLVVRAKEISGDERSVHERSLEILDDELPRSAEDTGW